MQRMICGKTLRDGISTELIFELIGIKKIEDFFIELKLQWFGLIKRMDDERAQQ